MLFFNTRPAVLVVIEPIHDGVFGLEIGELGVGEELAVLRQFAVDRGQTEGLMDVHEALPMDVGELLVHGLFVVAFEAIEAFKNTADDPGGQDGLKGHEGVIGGECRPASYMSDTFGPCLPELFL